MMNDIEELLHDGIDRLTAGATVPEGLAQRARQHHQHRRTAIRTTTAAGTAVVAVAAVTAASGVLAAPARHHGGTLRLQTTAYVTGRLADALGAAAQRNSVQEIHTTGHHAWFTLTVRNQSAAAINAPIGTVVPASAMGKTVAANKVNMWLHNGQLRQEGLTTAGQVVYDANSSTVRSAAGQQITGDGVDYQDKTWWHTTIRQRPESGGTPALSCSNVDLPPAVGSPVDWAAQIREARACGTYRVAGHQYVDGVDAIKLESAKPEPGPSISQTIWINPTTYLPVRVETKSGGSDVVGDFRWLRPTAANLAELKVAVPAGYTQVAAAGLPFVGYSWTQRLAKRPSPAPVSSAP